MKLTDTQRRELIAKGVMDVCKAVSLTSQLLSENQEKTQHTQTVLALACASCAIAIKNLLEDHHPGQTLTWREVRKMYLRTMAAAFDTAVEDYVEDRRDAHQDEAV